MSRGENKINYVQKRECWQKVCQGNVWQSDTKAKDENREKEEQVEKLRKEISWYRGDNTDKWHIIGLLKFNNKAVKVYDN